MNPKKNRNILLYSDTARSADALHFGGVAMHDPFIALSARGRKYAVVSALEFGRVKRHSDFGTVLPLEAWLEKARRAWPRRSPHRPTIHPSAASHLRYPDNAHRTNRSPQQKQAARHAPHRAGQATVRTPRLATFFLGAFRRSTCFEGYGLQPVHQPCKIGGALAPEGMPMHSTEPNISSPPLFSPRPLPQNGIESTPGANASSRTIYYQKCHDNQESPRPLCPFPHWNAPRGQCADGALQLVVRPPHGRRFPSPH